MSAVPSPIAHDVERSGSDTPKLATRAAVYFFVVAAITTAIALPLLSRLSPHTPGWATFVILGTIAAVAQLFVVRTPRNQSYHTTIVFLIPAAMLLPPELVVLIGVAMHIPEWLKSRSAWYIQIFNICNWTLSMLAAYAAFHGFQGLGSGDFNYAIAGLAAAASIVAVNHLLMAPMLHLARGHSMRESGLFSFPSLSTDLVLAMLGVSMAAFWGSNPWLIPFSVAPLLLIHRSLSVPQLQEEARVDPKTGLFNARHFAQALNEELLRAERFERPLSLIMADLDLLRDINNTYGHLAGDAVLQGIAEVFRSHLRHYDVPARFGGEEFAILLPETTPEQAFEIAERIRRTVAARTYDVETSSEPIRATVSIGVAAFPRDGADANELIHQADLAVYRAKLQGRNRVLDASSEPLLMPEKRQSRLVAVPEDGDHIVPLPPPAESVPDLERRHPRPHAMHGPRFLSLSRRLAVFVGIVSAAGLVAGSLGAIYGHNTDWLGLIALVALVGAGQALALEVDDGSISVSAVGSIAGAALFGVRAAIALAITIAAVEWSARRSPFHYVVFNIGTLALSSLAAAAVFTSGFLAPDGMQKFVYVAAGIAAGAYLLHGQHDAAERGGRDRGPRALVGGLQGALRLARDALPRLRLHRRRDLGRQRVGRPLGPRRLRGAAAADAQDAGGLPAAHAAQRAEAPRRGRDDPDPERLARARQPAAQGALDGGHAEPLGHGRRTRRLHRRPLAARAATRAGDRPRARPLAGGARPARTCGALPRHRQAGDPRRDPAQAREPDRRRSGS